MARKRKGLSPKQIGHIEEEYGLSYAMFKAFPELGNLLQDAIKDHWSPVRFQAEFRQTNFFKHHSDVWRKNMALKKTDPATYHERWNNNRTQYKDLAASMGVRLSPQTLGRLAERGLLFGWDEGQIRGVLSRYVRPSRTGDYGGDLSAAENDLSSLAYQNGIRISRGQMRNWMKSIARGDATQDQYEKHIRNVAASTFSIYGDQIRHGANVYDIATPYMQAMAQTLELNPSSLDLFDPTIRRAVSGVRTKKGEREPLSITDFEDQLRQDRRWQYTQTATDQAKGFTRALSQMWGLG